MTEETVVPVKTAAGLTKTMAPRREDTIVKEDLPKVSGDIADFHRNVVAVIRDGAEPEIKLFQVMRVMKLMDKPGDRISGPGVTKKILNNYR